MNIKQKTLRVYYSCIKRKKLFGQPNIRKRDASDTSCKRYNFIRILLEHLLRKRMSQNTRIGKEVASCFLLTGTFLVM